MGVKVERFFVQRMKTQWGSCNPASAQHPPQHRTGQEAARVPGIHRRARDGPLLEPTHNARFVALMDRFMPKWQFYREVLNRLPVRHENWAY